MVYFIIIGQLILEGGKIEVIDSASTNIQLTPDYILGNGWGLSKNGIIINGVLYSQKTVNGGWTLTDNNIGGDFLQWRNIESVTALPSNPSSDVIYFIRE